MQHTPDLAAPSTADELDRLTRDATRLGRETVDIGGFLQELDDQCHVQLDDLGGIKTHTNTLSDTSERMVNAVQRMAATADEAIEKVEQSTAFIAQNSNNAQELAEWVRSVHSESATVEEMLQAVRMSNSEISDIAWQVHILAVNAKIEAARAGQAGKGFSIVADSVSELSQKTATAADTISATVKRLSEWMARLHHGAQVTSQKAEEVLDRSSGADMALSEIDTRMGSLRDDAHGLAGETTAAKDAVDQVGGAVRTIINSVTSVTNGVEEATRRCNSLVDTSENILQHTVALGGSGEDSGMITQAQDLAGQVAQAFENALQRGRVSMAQLFDESYRPIPGTNPEQVTTGFTKLADSLLPQIQEHIVATVPKVVFCAAVDRNGYLPTHNKKFSQPQSKDPIWNAGNCRNRRIFDDRVGLKAGQSQAPFLLQVYRRDMGGGNFVLMKDLSAPIKIQGRHWGGIRIGYQI
ncbi:methyl-accepting chemotaxis protein [Pelagimonas varians]|uniref:Methyl-accepting chemotaxis protein 4 n=1 Tax=Pelagimonas varians TaxID=696760 RepID=A0A238JRF2_9RHOB|nr:methyl-accepting chemotaxis protein [Pelagimonas varians]PYG34703.1 methyl-accepting chemotaxis protein [Pelagimonas varians]SMX32784.1 Methyl-accepting chemotaxis protein 4 [Pelagimonas varians]